MKRFMVIVAACALAPVLLNAGDEGSVDRLRVSLGDPSRPARLNVGCINGRIVVHGANIRDMGVEAKGGAGPRRHGPERAEGLRRLESATPGLSIDQNDNEITVSTHSVMTNADLSIEVPVNTSVKLKTVMGDIEVDGISGDLEVESTNGRMTLTNVSGAALVHGVNGTIVANFTRIPADKPMSFSSLNGDIDLTLPADVHARLKMKTTNGDAYSDFDIALQPQTIVDEKDGDRNHRHMTVEHAVTGVINGGGPEIQLVTFNGNIKIRKRK